MTPAADQPFFLASMGAAAALLGLLFVAVSVSPEQTVGAGAPIERQMVAESVFTALVNAFFVSMGGTVPGISLGDLTLVLSVFALFQSLHVARKLWPARLTVRLAIRRLGLVTVALVIYGLQFANATLLIQSPTESSAVGSEIGLLFALYAFALGRSWQLLGARRGILSGHLSSSVEDDSAPETVAPPRRTPVVPSEAVDVASEEG